MQPLFTELLDLPGIDVEDYKIFDDKIILEVEAHAVRAVCPRCQTESTHLHQNHGYFVRDLNLMGRSVLLGACQVCIEYKYSMDARQVCQVS